MTMIERIVEALKSVPVRDSAAPGGELDQLRLREAARAVLTSMREPTKAMLEAEGTEDTGGKAKISGYLDYFSADEIWKAMIDAAVGEGE